MPPVESAAIDENAAKQLDLFLAGKRIDGVRVYHNGIRLDLSELHTDLRIRSSCFLPCFGELRLRGIDSLEQLSEVSPEEAGYTLLTFHS